MVLDVAHRTSHADYLRVEHGNQAEVIDEVDFDEMLERIAIQADDRIEQAKRNRLADNRRPSYRNVMFGSDYPHLEGTFGHTQDTLRALFDGVDDDVRHRITVGTFLEPFPHVGEAPVA